jgi:CubicO group peptidase (beta-lactamase class C family)
MNKAAVDGFVKPGFESVRDQFIKNFSQRGELGAACAIYHRGERVVDLWGGFMNKEKTIRWKEDTVVLVYSVTKGMAALATAMADSKGLLSYDQPVVNLWPAFAANGKSKITVEQLVSERAGLCAIDLPLDFEKMADLNLLTSTLARQVPEWPPDTQHGNHAYTIGWIHSQLLRCCDPKGRSLRTFFQEEIAAPLQACFFIGLPADFPTHRIARIDGFKGWEMVFHICTLPWQMVLALLFPWTLSYKTLNNPKLSGPGDLDTPSHWHLEDGGAGGIGEARGLAAIYNEFATGGKVLHVAAKTLEKLYEMPEEPKGGWKDQILKTDIRYWLGLEKPFDGFPFGTSSKAFGTFGVGGSFAFADPDAEVGYAYVTNKLGFYKWGDPREKSVRDAFYNCLKK